MIEFQHNNLGGPKPNQDQQGEILEKYKIIPKCKAWSACSIMHDGSHANVNLAFRIDILKME